MKRGTKLSPKLTHSGCSLHPASKFAAGVNSGDSPLTMGLLDIPLEIVDVIIDLCLPLGIESLALTCKALHERARSQIQLHNKLKRRWKRTTNYSTPKREDTLRILYEISRDPLVADYIEVLDLWDQREEEATLATTNEDLYDFRTDKKAMANLKATVTASPIFAYTDIPAEEWWDQILREDAEEVVNDEKWRTAVTLLISLPNLKVLRLFPEWNTFEDHWINQYEQVLPGLVGLINAANDNDRCDVPLGKLQAILPFMHEGYEEKAGLQCVQPFMTLNSLSEMYLVSAVGVDDGYSGIPFEWKSLGIASSLTRIELVSSCIDDEGIGELVAFTPNLITLRYSHETKYHGCQHDWNPGTFVETLGRHCGNTLTELALTIDELYGAVINGASSFLSLARLKLLEVDDFIFCGPPVESGQRLGEDAFVPDGARPWTKDDIPCIGSMLPSSIVEVHINTGSPSPDMEALQALVKNLKEQRKERLHSLERVIVRQYGGSSARVLVESHGATLEPFDDEVPEMRLRSSMPNWKRDFEARVRDLVS
jgi:hypothetical protein